jgi:hypothetical protein
VNSQASSSSQIGSSASAQIKSANAAAKVYVKIKNMLFNTSDFSANDDKETGQQQQQR